MLGMHIAAWDQQISDFIVAHRTAAGNFVFSLITMLGDWQGLLLIFLGFTVFLWKKHKNPLLTLWPSISAVFSWGLLLAMKNGVQRERPTVEPLVQALGYSFPSMHAAISTLCYGWIAFLLLSQGLAAGSWRGRIKLGAGLLAFLIGFSRMYLNVHFCTDVFAGWILGGLFLILSIQIYRRVSR